jgi:deoxycytidylate deaminase
MWDEKQEWIPVTPHFDFVLRAIQSSWNRETSADPEHWASENPAWGQCAVTALALDDFLGGFIAKILRFDISGSKYPEIATMRSHYLNVVRGPTRSDLTKSQFFDIDEYIELVRNKDGEDRTREYLLSNEKTRERYVKLRMAVARELAHNNPLFDDDVYRWCLKKALLSNCQKGKYGCAILHGANPIPVIMRCNTVLEPLSDWCEPECIRKTIQSRTDSTIGCCAHAEERATVGLCDLEINSRRCSLYVAGFRSNGLAYIKDEPMFTCLRCAVQIYMHGIKSVFVPVKDHWEELSAEEAVKSAKQFALGEKTI